MGRNVPTAQLLCQLHLVFFKLQMTVIPLVQEFHIALARWKVRRVSRLKLSEWTTNDLEFSAEPLLNCCIDTYNMWKMGKENF